MQTDEMSIQSTRSESMHFELTVDIPLESIDMDGLKEYDQKVCFTNDIDVALVFDLPCGVYTDVYELEV